MKNAMRWILITMMTVAVMASVLGGANVAMAADETTAVEVTADTECPQQVGNGVICTGPSIPTGPDTEVPGTELDEAGLTFQLGDPLKVGDADDAEKSDDSECPIPVGNGVICTGPTLPSGEPVDGQSVTFDQWVFLPVIRS